MDNLTKLLQNTNLDEVILDIEDKLQKSDEPDFFIEKIVPFCRAILSVLFELREQKILFNPEGNTQKTLDSALFLRWNDLVCLRTLYFILNQSNENEKLMRTSYKDVNYKKVNIEILQEYLVSLRISLDDEDSLDFPVATYNLHIGMTTIIKNLYK